MATSQQFLLCDNSTYANYSSWATVIPTLLAGWGWLQSVDTGQVMWSGMNLTQVAMSGTNATYTFNTLTGLALAIGRTLTITGMTNSANNGTFRITALAVSTFTVVNASGVNEAGSTGVVTKQTVVPGSGLFLSEIWQPGDGLQNYYLKIGYGNISGSNSPTLQIQVGTSTNGASTLTGFTTTSTSLATNSFTAPSTTATYECNFSGDSGRICLMLWRNAPNNAPQLFAIQRSLNNTGTPTSTYITLWAAGNSGGIGTQGQTGFQQSLYFGIGPTPASPNNSGGWYCLGPTFASTGTSAFNGQIGISFASPYVGLYDFPCTAVGSTLASDIAEGVPFTVTNQYGQTKTYMPSKVSTIAWAPGGGQIAHAACMEYD